MTLLMWHQTDEEINILMDTLATYPNGLPHHFQTKCWALPDKKMVVAGTGLANFLEAWNQRLQHRLLARDITMLNDHAPTALRSLWAEMMSQPDAPADSTVTVYHFGWDEQTGALVRYTYRSERDFESEFGPEPSFAIKPAHQQPMPQEWPTTIEEMVSLACGMRAAEDAKSDPSRRVYIGGELIWTHLKNGLIISAPAFRFDDYDDMWNRMNELALSGVGSEGFAELDA